MDINNVLVSVIIPAYNVGVYIEKCISSIRAQTYNNIEIIVINDGSTDNTEQIVQKLCKIDKRILLINRPNSGVSSSRNYGIDIAKGDWLVFVDGDDYLSEDYVEYMLSAILSMRAEYCISTHCFKSVKDRQQNSLKICEYSPEESTALLLSHRVDVGCWNKMFSKILLDKHQIRFNTSLFYGEGLHFITRVSQVANRTCVINKKLYYYRQDNAYSATKHFDVVKIYNGWRALDVIEQELVLKSKLIKRRLEQHRCLFSLNAVTKILNSNSQEQYSREYKKFLGYVRKKMSICLIDREMSNNIKVKLILCSTIPQVLSFFSLRSQKKRAQESV